MKEICPLQSLLTEHLVWNQARINFVAQFLLALLKVKTVNLSQLAVAFSGPVKVDSHYKRIKRFLKAFPLDFEAIAQLVISLLPLPAKGWVLTLDRTQWKLGKTNVNILVLAIAYEGVAFPIFWRVLTKYGCSNIRERRGILRRFFKVFGKGCTLYLTADREFMSKAFLSFLKQHHMHFCLRLKANMKVTNSRGIPRPAKVLFRHLPINQFVNLGQRHLWGETLYLVGMKQANRDYLILATTQQPETAKEQYARRWEIESLFSCLKTRGFCFESTHLTQPKRVSKLLALMTIALCWAYRTGQWRQTIEPIKLLKHKRPAQSIFRYGLDWLRNILLNLSTKYRDFLFVLKFLSPT